MNRFLRLQSGRGTWGVTDSKKHFEVLWEKGLVPRCWHYPGFREATTEEVDAYYDICNLLNREHYYDKTIRQTYNKIGYPEYQVISYYEMFVSFDNTGQVYVVEQQRNQPYDTRLPQDRRFVIPEDFDLLGTLTKKKKGRIYL